MGVVDWGNAVNVNLNNLSIDTIYITAAGYYKRPFKGISRDSVLGWEEPVWGGDLTRSTGFELSNITDVDFGKVARVEVSYKFMNIDDYKALCEIAKQRVCYVIYFNRETATWEYGNNGYGQEMAFTGNELGKLFTYGYKFVGGLDIKIKLVATNRDKADIRNQYTISYNANGGIGTVPTSVTRTWSENLKIADGSGLSRTGYTFIGWNTKTDGTGQTYMANQDVTIYSNMTLYAKWDVSPTEELVYSGLDGNGEITNIESEIVAYMIGTGNPMQNGNGLSSGFSGSLVNIPTTHNGKPITTIGQNAFSDYTIITTINLPDSLRTIMPDAFANCIGLTTINLPSSLNTIYSNAFGGCSGLTTVTVPASVNNMQNPFNYCTGLQTANIYCTNVTVKATRSAQAWFNSCSNNLQIHIPSTVLSPSDSYGSYWNYNSLVSGNYYSYTADL